jgi:hypothetical protein
MANRYARSTTGVNTNDGTTWALANLDLVGAVADSAAGDTIFVSQAHAENTAGAALIALPGTVASPVKVICANDSAEPPTSAASSATVTATSTITVTGVGYLEGITFRPGSGGTVTQGFSASGSVANTNQVYKNCSVQMLTSGTGLAKMIFGDESRADSTHFRLQNFTAKFGGINQRIKLGGNFRWDGGSFVSGTVAPVNVFEGSLRGTAEFNVRGVDFTNLGTAFNLFLQNQGGNAFTGRFNNIQLPAGWAGGLWSASPTAPWIRIEVTNSLLGTTKIRYWMHDFCGQVRDNTTVTRTGGASDDGVAFSMRMASSTGTSYPAIPLECAPIRTWVDSTAQQTINVEIVHDSQGSGAGAALRNDEIAIRVIGPGNDVSNLKAEFLAAVADHATSSAAWTTTGLTTPVKQKLSITFTPTAKGEHTIVVSLFASSKTVYVCPKVS